MKVFVLDLSPEIETETLRTAFAPFGEISDCQVVIRKEKSKGYGFVSFVHKKDANTAIEQMNGKWPDRAEHGKVDTSQYHHIFIRKLSRNFEAENLHAMFNTFGEISDCQVVKDMVTGKSKRYGFVSFVRKKAVTDALEFYKEYDVGPAIRTNWATRKPAANLNSNNNENCSIIVGDLSPDIETETLRTAFAPFGEISDCRIIADMVTGKSKEFGFISFVRKEDATTAIEQMKGQWPKPVGKVDTSQYYHIFVGDLSPEIDTETLRNAFAPFGEISDCQVVKDMATGKSKEYGFVSFVHKKDATSAIEKMNGRWLGSRSIRTNWATRKPAALSSNNNEVPQGKKRGRKPMDPALKLKMRAENRAANLEKRKLQKRQSRANIKANWYGLGIQFGEPKLALLFLKSFLELAWSIL